jgi:hypothetical protein
LASPDGLPDGILTTDLCRRRADVVVRRTSSEGGGIVGLRHALLRADQYKEGIRRLFGYLLLSQAARLCLVILPLLLGLSAAAAPALLVSGLCVDLLVILQALYLPLPNALSKRERMEDTVAKPLALHRGGLIAVAVSTAVPVLTAAVCRYLTVDFGGDPVHYLTLCLLGLQPAIYRLSPLPRRNRSVFFTTLLLALSYVAALAIALGAGLGLLWSLVLPLSTPALYVAVKLVLDRTTGKKGTASKP